MTSTPALEMRGITKRFGKTLALNGVDFSLVPGEIHALLGENGAGKSALMNVLSGLTKPTAGTIRMSGDTKIGMVHQHFLLVPSFTVAENLALGSSLSAAEITKQSAQIASRLRWNIPMASRVADLPVGTQQRVEILKALLGDARILLFDEPTAVLAPNEIEELFAVLRQLRAEGRALVFVSHKLNEVMALCDRVTVLRRGRVVGTVNITETNPDDLAARMVGEAGIQISPNITAILPASPESAPVLEAANLSTTAETDAIALRELNFTLHRGETLGFAGVDGNGQAELAGALAGLRRSSGTLAVNGSIALIPPDRHQQGLAMSLSVAENLQLQAARLPQFRCGPWGMFLDRRKLAAFAASVVQDFDIRVTDLNLPVAALSGGNQQKIVVARALWRKPAIVIAVSPTRGLDVAAAAYVHGKLRERQASGGATILISTELDEVVAWSTRIAVLYEGRIMGIVPPDTPRETLGLMMGGRNA